MKTKTYTLILLVVILSLKGYSQAPGYIGKTILVNYNIDFSPHLRTFGFDDILPLKFNLMSGFDADYVFGRHMSVGLKLSYFNTNFDFSEICYFDTNLYGVDYNNMEFRSNALAQMKITSIGVNLKLFSRNHLAPLGVYSEFEFNYYKYNITYNEDSLYKYAFQNQWNQKIVPEFGNTMFPAFGLNYTIGYQRIFFDRLVTNVGVKFGWLLAANPNIYSLAGDLYLQNEDYLKIISQRRLQFNTLVNIEAGVGILIF